MSALDKEGSLLGSSILRPITLTLLLLSFCCALASAQEHIILAPGQQETVSVPGARSIHIGSQTIATAKELRVGEIIITGHKPGTTTLTIVDAYGRKDTRIIEVVSRDPQAVIRELRQMLGDVEGLHFTQSGSKVIAQGRIISQSDEKRFSKAIAMYPEVINRVSVMAKAKLIGVEVWVVEIDKDVADQFNPTPPTASVSGSGEATLERPGEFEGEVRWSVTHDVLSQVSYWMRRGKAEISAKPRVVVKDGETASFLSGGEYPYVASTPNGIIVTWKEFGVNLDVTPEHQASGEIVLSLMIEMTELDESKMTPIGPPLSKRRAETRIAVANGKTLTIAGLRKITRARSRRLNCLLPFLSSFGATTRETEVLILVTPSSPPSIGEFPVLQEERELK